MYVNIVKLTVTCLASVKVGCTSNATIRKLLDVSKACRFSLCYQGLLALLLPLCFHGFCKRKHRPGGRRVSV